MSLRIHLERRVDPKTVDPLAVRRFAKSVLRGEGVADGSVTLVLTDDAQIHELNRQFRDKDRPTDVLAFPDHDDPDDPVFDGSEGAGRYLGDVVISLERARAQAPRFHNTPDAELARLITHGLLHLLGYDHHAPAEGRRMKAAERRAMTAYLPGTLLRGDTEALA